MYLLLVEDNDTNRRLIKMGLEQMGCTVDEAPDGIEGEKMALANSYDLLVIDWMMPRMDGLTLTQRLRAAGINTPILMLTAKSEVEDEVEGLQAGADDYISKPFSFQVLEARIRALGRRATMETEETQLQLGPLRLSRLERTASLNGEPLPLRAKEFALLDVLATRPGTLVTRMVIAEQVWGTHYVTDDVINTTVASLRRKVRAASKGSGLPPFRIETVRGAGYRLEMNSPAFS